MNIHRNVTDFFFIGPLLKKIIKEMETRNETKFFMYSAHDSTVACNLETLGLYNKISPPYASTVIYELHSTQEGLFVKVHNASFKGLKSF